MDDVEEEGCDWVGRRGKGLGGGGGKRKGRMSSFHPAASARTCSAQKREKTRALGMNEMQPLPQPTARSLPLLGFYAHCSIGITDRKTLNEFRWGGAGVGREAAVSLWEAGTP